MDARRRRRRSVILALIERVRELVDEITAREYVDVHPGPLGTGDVIIFERRSLRGRVLERRETVHY